MTPRTTSIISRLGRLARALSRRIKAAKRGEARDASHEYRLVQMCCEAYQNAFTEALNEHRSDWSEARTGWLNLPPPKDWLPEVQSAMPWKSGMAVFLAYLDGRRVGEAERKRREPKQFDLFGAIPA